MTFTDILGVINNDVELGIVINNDVELGMPSQCYLTNEGNNGMFNDNNDFCAIIRNEAMKIQDHYKVISRKNFSSDYVIFIIYNVDILTPSLRNDLKQRLWSYMLDKMDCIDNGFYGEDSFAFVQEYENKDHKIKFYFNARQSFVTINYLEIHNLINVFLSTYLMKNNFKMAHGEKHIEMGMKKIKKHPRERLYIHSSGYYSPGGMPVQLPLSHHYNHDEERKEWATVSEIYGLKIKNEELCLKIRDLKNKLNNINT